MGTLKFQHSAKMEAFKLENLKSQYEKETPEEKLARQKKQIWTVFLQLGVGIFQLVTGLIHDYPKEIDDDSKEPMGCENGASHFLIVSGSVQIVGSAIKIFSVYTPWKWDDKLADFIGPCCDFAYMVVMIWGSVVVFSAYSDWRGKGEYDDDGQEAN